MNPLNQTPALPPLSLAAEMKKGITDRGSFQWVAAASGGGRFDHVKFNAPPQQFAKPTLAKVRSNDAEVQTRLLSHRTEKALNLRDALFAELARDNCREKVVNKLGSHLSELGTKGVQLDEINWSMGSETLTVHGKESKFGWLHTNSPRHVKDNVSKMMYPHGRGAPRDLSDGALTSCEGFNSLSQGRTKPPCLRSPFKVRKGVNGFEARWIGRTTHSRNLGIKRLF
ncbi:MAG: hypothetical protein Q7T87_22060 [Polaromonas sp.]|nr:hypothetical protein [Polaromonas sp.]